MSRLYGLLSFLLLGYAASVLGATAVPAAESRRPPHPMAQRVLACTSCHGNQGRATPEGYFPRIAGKPAGYLYNQLLNFREGRRNYPLMVYLAEYMTDDYLRQIAQYFAAIDLPYPAPQPANLSADALRRAEALVRRGDPARKIPACGECHGQDLLGAAPYVPGLLGLSRDYLYGQLGFWKNGERRAHEPDCMAKIASQLTPEEVGDVSAWLASQAAPVGAKPAPGLAGPLPTACGNVPR